MPSGESEKKRVLRVMMSALIKGACLSTPEAYVECLYKETAYIIKHENYCKQHLYDRIYENVTIIGLVTNDKTHGREEIIRTLRIKCKDKKFTAETMPHLGSYTDEYVDHTKDGK